MIWSSSSFRFPVAYSEICCCVVFSTFAKSACLILCITFNLLIGVIFTLDFSFLWMYGDYVAKAYSEDEALEKLGALQKDYPKGTHFEMDIYKIRSETNDK